MILHLKKFLTKKYQKLKKFSLPWEMVLPQMLGTVLLRLKVKCSPTMLDLTHEVFFLIAILNYWLLRKCRVHRERTWCTYSPSPGLSGASANLMQQRDRRKAKASEVVQRSSIHCQGRWYYRQMESSFQVCMAR